MSSFKEKDLFSWISSWIRNSVTCDTPIFLMPHTHMYVLAHLVHTSICLKIYSRTTSPSHQEAYWGRFSRMGGKSLQS